MHALVLALVLCALPPGEADDQADFVAGLFAKGLHGEAVEEARAFLRSHADHELAPQVRYQLAQSLVELERPEDAEPHLARLAARDAFEFAAEARYLLAHCRLARGAAREAVAELERLLARCPDYLRSSAALLLGEARFDAADFAGAENAYRDALESADRGGDGSGDAIRARFGLAWCAFRTGDDAAALARAEGLLRSDPAGALASELHYLRGEALAALDRPEEALAAFERAAGGPQSEAALRGAAFASAALDRPAEAARCFAALLEAHPRGTYTREARLQRGVQLHAAGELEAAHAALRDVELPEGPESAYWRARAAADVGRAAEARPTLERALRADPGEAWAPRLAALLGDVLAELGEAESAVGAYRAAGSDRALYAAAALALNEGRTGEAERLAAELLERHPASPLAPLAELARGEALFQEERCDEARPLLERAAAVLEGPERARALSRLAWCAYLAGDADAAAGRFAALARAHPDAPEAEEARYMEARALEDAGDRAEARRSYARYVETHPSGERVAAGLFALARTTDGPAAEPPLERLVREHPDDPLAPDALLALGELRSEAGRGNEAREAYRALLELHGSSPHVPPAAYGLAWSHHEDGESAAAASALEALLARSDVPDALRLSALELAVWCAVDVGDLAGARRHEARLAASCDDGGRVLRAGLRVAEALREAGRLAPARSLLAERAGAAGDPRTAVPALVEGAFLALEVGDLDDAEARAREAARRGPQDPTAAEALFFVGEAAFAAEEDARAAELYALACRVPSPVRDGALYKEGFARLRLDEPRAAAEAFAAVAEEHASSELYGECLYLAGEALLRAGDDAAAIAWLERLRRERPRHESLPRALFRGGVALVRLERWEDAARWLAELARDHSDFEASLEGELWRGRALAELGDRRGARAAFERVVAGHEGVLAARARLGLGRLRLDAGEVDAALSEFLRVAVLYDHDEEVAEALLLAGRCFERLGRPERALEQYRELLEEHPDAAAAPAARQRLRALD